MKKRLLGYCIAFCILIASFLLFMVLGCLMPDQKVRRNVTRSAPPLERQGNYPHAIYDKEVCQMDNFTDGLILSMAYFVSADSMRTSMFANPHANVGMDMSIGLKRVVENDIPSMRYYPRYWHGSVFLTRFLLLFGNYEFIRQMLQVIAMALLLIASVVIYKQVGLPLTLAYFSGFIFLHGFIMQFSIQFFPVWALTLICSIVMCYKWKDFSKVLLLLFVTGSVTAFFDLLTTPLLTMALPLLLYLILSRKENESWGQGLWKIVRGGIAWCAGFVCTWCTKWLLSTVFTGQNVFQDAFSQVAYRSEASADFSRLDAVSQNLSMVNFPLLTWFIIPLIILMVFFFCKKNIKTSSLCLLFIFVPYAWYFVVADHSYCHWWFTYRLQMMSVTALLLGIAVLIDWTRAAKFIHKHHLKISTIQKKKSRK